MHKILLAGVPAAVGAWLQAKLTDVSVETVNTDYETLERLVSDRWSLLLIDQSLPGAFQLLATLRTGKGVARPPIMYSVQSVTDRQLLERLVSELGVDQLLVHPLDPNELVRQVAAMARISYQPVLAERVPLESLWERHRGENLKRAAELVRAAEAMRGDRLTDEQRGAAERAAHKLNGALGTFGLMTGSELARDMESILAKDGKLRPSLVVRFSDLSEKLQRLVQEHSTCGGEPVLAGEEDGPVVLLVSSDRELTDHLAVEGRALGLRLVPYTAPEARAVPPTVALVDFSEDIEKRRRVVHEFSQAPGGGIPTVVITRGASLSQRLEAVKHGARGLVDRSQGARAILALAQGFLERLESEYLRVLAVDDDPQVLALLRRLLKDNCLETLSDPLKFYERLTAFQPDLLILDVDMPGLSGIELCRVARSYPRWKATPILFLTALTDRRIVRQMFEAGADDYVSKPLVGPELIARINNRLERIRILRKLSGTDPVSGAITRDHSLEVFGRSLRLAARLGQPLSLALIELDAVAPTKQRFGPGVVDAVLARLGQLLLREFPDQDQVARWGGEDFAVVAFGLQRAEMSARLTEVLEGFKAQRFQTPRGEFGASFSAGIAQFPEEGEDLEALCRAAETAAAEAALSGGGAVRPPPAHSEAHRGGAWG